MKKIILIFLLGLFSLGFTVQESEHKPIKKQKKEVITNDNPFLNPKSYEQDLDITYDAVDYGQDITNEDYDWNIAFDTDETRAQNKPSTLLAIILFIILILSIIVFYKKRNNSKPEFNLLTENMKEEKSNNTSGWVILIVVILVSWGIGGIIDGKDFSYGIKSNISALFSLITIAIIGIFIYNAFFKKYFFSKFSKHFFYREN